MTDPTKFPTAKPAKWSSGRPDRRHQRADLPGTRPGAAGRARWRWRCSRARASSCSSWTPDQGGHASARSARSAAYGRIRTVQYGPDGALYFTTSNGSGNDVVGRISASATPPRWPRGTNISPVGASAVRTGRHVRLRPHHRQPGRVQAQHRRRRTWPSGWTDTRLTSTSAPASASSAAGRVDLVTRSADRTVTHLARRTGSARGQTNLGGLVTIATISSLGDGTLDVFALQPERRRLPQALRRQRWSAWQSSAAAVHLRGRRLGAAVDQADPDHRPGRGPAGRTSAR